MKVAINKCYGGFGLSKEAKLEYLRKKDIVPSFYKVENKYDRKQKFYKITKDEYLRGKGWDEHIVLEDLGEEPTNEEISGKIWYNAIERNDPILIEVIEEMGDKANGSCSDINIIEIPDDVNWTIGEYDGMESVEETHRSWN